MKRRSADRDEEKTLAFPGEMKRRKARGGWGTEINRSASINDHRLLPKSIVSQREWISPLIAEEPIVLPG